MLGRSGSRVAEAEIARAGAAGIQGMVRVAPPDRRRSGAFRPGAGAALRAAGAALLLAALTGTAVAESPHPATPGPDAADLRVYASCSRAATARVLGMDEALGCARAYLRIKLSFVPGVEPEDYDRLSLRERAAIDAAAYGLYRDWLSDHPAEAEALRTPFPPAPELATR